MFTLNFFKKKDSKTPEFIGNKILDFFRNYIYFSVIVLSKISLNKNNNKPNKSKKKYLFAYRDWSEKTTLVQEFILTLKEAINNDDIIFIKLSNKQNIYKTLKTIIYENQFTHVFIDTRFMIVSNSIFSKFYSIYEARKLSILFNSNNIICICSVTDWFQPGYRLIAGLLTSAGGIALMHAGINVKETPEFFHKRILWPFYTPFSIETFNKLSNYQNKHIKNYDIAIIGSNYEPRKSLIKKLIIFLNKNNINYFLYSKKDLEYLEYLSIYKKSKIVFNTNWVVDDTNKFHNVGRNFEVLVVGSLLISQKCFGLDYYLTSGKDYVNFNNFNDLTKKILFYLKNEDQRKKIVDMGNKKVLKLYNNNYYLKQINKTLIKYNLNHIEI